VPFQCRKVVCFLDVFCDCFSTAHPFQPSIFLPFGGVSFSIQLGSGVAKSAVSYKFASWASVVAANFFCAIEIGSLAIARDGQDGFLFLKFFLKN
jgi:hypothetical protein